MNKLDIILKENDYSHTFYKDYKIEEKQVLIKDIEKFLSKEYGKCITFLLTLSIVLVLFFYKSSEPRIFLYDISISYISGVMFYFLIQFVPDSQRKASELTLLSEMVFRIDNILQFIHQDVENEFIARFPEFEGRKDEILKIGFGVLASNFNSNDIAISGKFKYIKSSKGFIKPNGELDCIYTNYEETCREKLLEINFLLKKLQDQMFRISFQDKYLHSLVQQMLLCSLEQVDKMKSFLKQDDLENMPKLIFWSLDRIKKDLDLFIVNISNNGSFFVNL